MKSILFLFLITAIFGFSVFAQKVKPKTPPLPVGIAGWNGEDSDKILKNAVIKARLKKLLGKKNYASFLESFETLTPIEKNGDILFSSGCLIHACTQLESAIAIDLVNKNIYAGKFTADWFVPARVWLAAASAFKATATASDNMNAAIFIFNIFL